MRRDVFIDNDSGGFSVVAAAAADRMTGDLGSRDDLTFVRAHQALLLELYGDDSMPVRIVVDEPLRPEEEAQWLARASWRIDAPDGRVLVMGGFDPDVLSDWMEEHAPDEDGHGVAVVKAAPGSWRVDVYAHVGSMNGRHILGEADEKPGAFFRRCHPGRAFPLWLAKMLELSGDDDPGHEELWKNPAASVRDGRLQIETDPASAVGFLVHLTPFGGQLSEPDGAWFSLNEGRRVPETFPLGLPADVPDPELEHFLDRLLDRPKPKEVIPVATGLVEIIERWSGDTLKRLIGGGERPLAVADAFHLYWMAGLLADSAPRFELWVTPSGPWTPPEASPECAVVAKGSSTWAIGPPPNTGGWFTWWAARQAAQSLAVVPDGSTLDLAMACDPKGEDANPAVGRALYSGLVKGDSWQIAEASPAVTRETLDDALSFVRDLVEHGRIAVRGPEEQRVFDAAAAMNAMITGPVIREGESARLAEPDERSTLILAAPVFRTRFVARWPADPIDVTEDAEGEADD